MNISTIIVLLIVLSLFTLAVKYNFKNKNKCAGCSACASCNKTCHRV